MDKSDALNSQRDNIINAAYKIGEHYGLASINARKVAQDAGVSVGYLYKLFPSKSDIVVAAARLYFKNSLFNELCHLEHGESYINYCKRLWACIESTITSFEDSWLKDIEYLPQDELKAAKAQMEITLMHTKSGLLQVLEQDQEINWEKLPEHIDKIAIADFTLQNFILALQNNDDASILFMLLERGLYSQD